MNKTILITGASRGIGHETALELAKQGHRVVATARSGNKLRELKQAAEPGKITTVTADLTRNQDISTLADAVAEFETLDGLINNAGAVHREPLVENDIAVWKKLMDVNVFAIVRLIQALKPKLGKDSHIVNISSMSGFQGSVKFPGLSAYAASKAAVIGLSEVLSTEFAEDGIAVNCLCLGAVKTEMLAEAFPGYEPPVTAKQMGAYLSDFVLNGHQLYNGQVLPVALNNPE